MNSEQKQKIEKYEAEMKEKWLIENAFESILIEKNNIPISSDIGKYIEVNGLQIPKDYFQFEFNAIENAYFSVIFKLKKLWENEYKEKYYQNLKSKNKEQNDKTD